MMTARGHEIFLYAGTENEANCTELIPCIIRSEQTNLGYKTPADYLKIDFNNDPIWEIFVRRAIEEIKKRLQPKDIICIITSSPFQPIVDAFPENQVVEFGIGYSHTIAKYRVFESYAWMHYVYGKGNEDGHDFDAVIPNYFEPEEFSLGTHDGGYYLFIGRLTEKKGYQIAIDVCKRLGKRLVVAGPGQPPEGVEYVGVVGPEERARLMGGATAVFVPTQYVGPFEGVAVEAMLCGTPVITSDFGAFTEYVENGFNGYRCRSFQDYIDAVKKIEYGGIMDERSIRESVERFLVGDIAKDYEAYFEKLLTLYGAGWYTIKE